MRTSLFGILTAALLSGCGTLQNLDDERTPYGGLAFDVDHAVHGSGYMEDMITRPLIVIDAPLSAVADTATLPITIAASIKQEKARRQYLAENDGKVKIAESAYRDDDGLKFRTDPPAGLED